MISILCPTRNRPGNVRRLIESARDTADGPLEFVFYADDDAPLPPDITSQDGVVTITGPRIMMSAMWNACWDRASGEIAMMGADDIAFRTPGWDTTVLAEFTKYPDRIVLVHGQDGIQGPDLGTHSFLHRRWVETVGYFTAPYFSRDFADTWINDLAIRIGRRVYLPEMYIEHLHPVVGKAPWDETHQERVIRGEHDDVDGIWARTGDERAGDAAKLQAVMAPSA